MAIKTIASVNIDRLKICYNLPTEFDLFSDLVSKSDLPTPTPKDEPAEKIWYDGFYLVAQDWEFSTNYGDCKRLSMMVVTSDDRKIGTLELRDDCKYGGKCFFTFECRALYTIETQYPDGTKFNMMGYINFIADELGLKFNNITLVELALDCNKNYITKVRKMIRNTDIEMFKNGHKITDENKVISNYGEYYSRTRKQLSKQPTLYFEQAKDTGLKLKIYNKSREMMEQEQEKLSYIPEWVGIPDGQDIYRCEITIRNTDLRDFCALNAPICPEWSEYDNIIGLLMMSDFRARLWGWASHRLIFFRENGVDIDLIDLI